MMCTLTDIFKTDTEISRSNGPSLSRELQVSVLVKPHPHVFIYLFIFQPFSFEDEKQSTLHLDDGVSETFLKAIFAVICYF